MSPASGVRVAVFPIDAIGHVNPLLPIVRALAGHPDVAQVRSFAPASLGPALTAAGACHVPVEAAAPSSSVPVGVSELAYRSFVEPLAVSERMTARAAEFRPDVVLYDVFCVHGLVAARALGVPSASLVTFPGYGALGEQFVLQHASREPASAGRRYRALYGWDPLEEGLLPVLFPSPDLSIVTAIESMSRRVDAVTAPRLHAALSRYEGTCAFVGPSVGEAGPHDRSDRSFPYDVLDAARRAGRSIVLFSLGTVLTGFRFGSPVGGAPSGRAYLLALLDHLIGALGDRDDVLVVVATGSSLTAADEPAWPGNFVVRAFLPQRELLNGYADAFITHHGTSSTAESLLAGVPMISVPGVGDQLPNAEIAIAGGAAVALWDPHDVFATVNADLLAKAVRQVLHDPSYRTACLTLRDRMTAAGGARRAAGLVVSLGRRSSRSGPIGSRS